ncbi:hypothetical protein KUTeg_017913 [Tegillarca granosa]|uniref:SHSP domain-containing protein n=1 Tax=Tegillarca granosa TaxID=220873 RepID=A0ABQ9ELA2_TEGGR|nr:hypothetical protein KUTeg_017913 [Tegillarca granosa]
MHRYDWCFFDKQRDLYPKYSSVIELDVHGFNNELDKWKNGMHQLHPFDMQAVQPRPLQLESPFVEDADGNRKLSLTYDCAQFNPEDIEVKTNDSSITVHAKHTEGSEGNTMTREFTRTYNLPNGVDHRQVVSHLTSDGVLHIEAPAPPNVYTRKEILIPIQRLKQH